LIVAVENVEGINTVATSTTTAAISSVEKKKEEIFVKDDQGNLLS
jgi:hypothetical protein